MHASSCECETHELKPCPKSCTGGSIHFERPGQVLTMPRRRTKLCSSQPSRAQTLAFPAGTASPHRNRAMAHRMRSTRSAVRQRENVPCHRPQLDQRTVRLGSRRSSWCRQRDWLCSGGSARVLSGRGIEWFGLEDRRGRRRHRRTVGSGENEPEFPAPRRRRQRALYSGRSPRKDDPRR